MFYNRQFTSICGFSIKNLFIHQFKRKIKGSDAFYTFVFVKFKIRNIFAIWFLVSLLIFAITPKEIFHEFHDHEQEIEHIDLDCHNQHFEVKHNHCQVLNQLAQVFYFTANVESVPFFKAIAEFKVKSKVYLKTPQHFMFGLKAPPVLYFQ